MGNKAIYIPSTNDSGLNGDIIVVLFPFILHNSSSIIFIIMLVLIIIIIIIINIHIEGRKSSFHLIQLMKYDEHWKPHIRIFHN